MPNISSIRRKSPFDLNKNVRIGTAFPLDETNLFSGTETLMDQAKANLINVLLTYPGERVNMPNFGVGLKKLLFENKIDLITIEEKIKKQSAYYVPNIIVTRARVNMSKDRSVLFVTIAYKSTLDGTEDAIQLNFK